MDGNELKRRKDRLGLSDYRLAELADVSRGTVRRALESGDKAGYSHTFQKIVAALEAFEYEVGADAPEPVVSTITYPDGTVVTFSGPPTDVAKAVKDVLGGR